MITKDTDKKLFLLDAFALIYRAYFAFSKNPRINSKGENTSAAFGFTNAMLDIIRKEKPTHLAVVFDSPGKTNRAEDFTEYKANREEMPEDIRSMLDPIKEIVQGFNIPILIKSGFEADDIIGTVAKVAEKHGFTTYMMTPDKDFAQLVSENIFMYKPGRFGKGPEIWGVPEVCEKFEIDDPIKVIDILGLWGDAADNIPGIPGIGEKTSKKLVGQFGSVEGLIANSDQLKGKQKENVINFAEQGLMSKMLATIILDVDVPFEPENLVISEPNKEALKETFTNLEFRAIAKKVLGEEITVTASVPRVDDGGQIDMFGDPEANVKQEVVEDESIKTLADKTVDYVLVDTPEARQKLIAYLAKQKVVCFDTETSGLNSLEADLAGISFTWKENTGYYVTVPKEFDEAKKVVDEFLPFFNDTNNTKIAHNLKYDLKVLGRYDVKVNGTYFDTMVAHYLINPDSRHNMDYLAELYLNYQPISIETLIGKKGKNQKSMLDLDPKEVYNYACEDSDITFQLYQKFLPEIEKPHLKDLFFNIEMPLIPVLQGMETEGIKINTEELHVFSEKLGKDLDKLTIDIKGLADEDFNIDSPKQLGEVLFDKMAITDKAKKTKTGQYATNEDVLTKLKDTHEIIPLILDYRGMKKLKSTYVDALPELVSPRTGHIHTHYMQTVAATGRLSSNNPNLQNIPIRTEQGREIRKSFIPRNEDYTLMAADYSQIELRIIAALSQDKDMIAAFKNGHDIHSATAAKVFGVPMEEVTRDQRSSAKAVNFGIIYGQSAFGLSQKLNIKRREAKEIIDNYFEQYSSIKSYMDNNVAFAQENGYVETIMKRRRYLKDINSKNAIVRGFAERNAVNAPIQGSAADIIKVAMIKVQAELESKNLKTKMLLQVHDELVLDVHKSEIDVVTELVKRNMESAFEFDVPLTVEYELADNWLDAH